LLRYFVVLWSLFFVFYVCGVFSAGKRLICFALIDGRLDFEVIISLLFIIKNVV